MKLLRITKNNSLHFELDDKRLGVVYDNGYVRVSTKHSQSRLYQINQKLEVRSGKNYYYKRVLLRNTEDGIKMLYNFNLKNCQ